MSAVRHVKSWFDPETTQAMGKAFDIAWSDVEDVFNSGFMMDWAREQIAKRIIEMAEGGERDPQRLSRDAIRTLTNFTMGR